MWCSSRALRRNAYARSKDFLSFQNFNILSVLFPGQNLPLHYIPGSLSIPVCLSVLHTYTTCHSVNSIAIEPQNSARGLVHTTQPQPWSSGLWRGLMSFLTRSPDQRGNRWRLKQRHVGACEQVKDGREREAPRKPRRHTCTLQLPDTRENSRGGVVWSTVEQMKFVNFWPIYSSFILMFWDISYEPFLNRYLRCICQIFWPNKISNEQLYKKTSSQSITKDMRLRMEQDRLRRVALRWTPLGLEAQKHLA